MALAALAAVFLGFSRTYYLRPQFQDTSLPFYLQVHGAVFSAWIALFVAQKTEMVGFGNKFLPVNIVELEARAFDFVFDVLPEYHLQPAPFRQK